jgi:hypothetical protein
LKLLNSDFSVTHASDVPCGIASGAPIGGCDPPQPASIATAAQMPSAKKWLSSLTFIAKLS